MRKKTNIRKSMNSSTRDIFVTELYGEKLILFTLGNDGITDILSYDEALLNILQLNALQPFRYKGTWRLAFYVKDASGEYAKIMLHDLAYGCYHGFVDEDTFIDDIDSFRKYKTKYDLSIDHADSNQQNCTRYNLSLMPQSVNASKSDITRRFKIPVTVTACYTDGRYRIQLNRGGIDSSKLIESINTVFKENGVGGTISGGDTTLNQLCLCSDPYIFVEQLDDFADCAIRYTDGSIIGDPLRSRKGWANTDGEYAYADPLESVSAQIRLASLPESVFNKVESA